MQYKTQLTGLLTIAGLAAGLVAQETGTLKFRSHKNFEFVLPTEKWTPAAGSIAGVFKTAKDGMKMLVDTTGDGRLNASVRGTKGFLKFRRKVDGKVQDYAARFQGKNGVYTFAASGSMSGKIGGVPIHLLDMNNDGTFDQVGQDAIVVGRSKAACTLGKVISHKGKVFTIAISEGGTKATLTPYTGETGKIDLASGFRSQGKLASLVVSNEQGHSFNAAATVTVPVGNYTIESGLIRKGSQTARLRAGKIEAIAVDSKNTAKLAWGGPLVAEVQHVLLGGKVTVAPRDVRYFGRAGAEFYDFLPNAKSPKFTAIDTKTKKEVGGFQFEGCWGGGFTAGSVRVGDDVKDVDVTVTYNSSLFGKVRGSSKQPERKAQGPITGTR